MEVSRQKIESSETGFYSTLRYKKRKGILVWILGAFYIGFVTL